MRKHLAVKDDTHKAIRVAAAMADMQIAEFVEKLIKDYNKKQKKGE